MRQGSWTASATRSPASSAPGTVFSTRLVNALITDNGKVYVGAVTQDALLKAANAAK